MNIVLKQKKQTHPACRHFVTFPFIRRLDTNMVPEKEHHITAITRLLIKRCTSAHRNQSGSFV